MAENTTQGRPFTLYPYQIEYLVKRAQKESKQTRRQTSASAVLRQIIDKEMTAEKASKEQVPQ